MEQKFIYNKRHFDGNVLIDSKKSRSLSTFTCDNGTKIGMFQGNRGERKDLDFKIEFLQPGKKSRMRINLYAKKYKI